jgi:predicted O-methyltransferase YrrM
MLKGHFSLNGKLPKVSERVELHRGYFEQTLPGFLENNSEPFSFIHLDADTYQSTKYVLETVISRISIGTIIIFDEYLGYPSWQTGEFLAWQEIVKTYNIKYSYLGLSTAAISVRIEAI